MDKDIVGVDPSTTGYCISCEKIINNVWKVSVSTYRSASHPYALIVTDPSSKAELLFPFDARSPADKILTSWMLVNG